MIQESIAKCESGKTRLNDVTAAIRDVTEESLRVKSLVDQINVGSAGQANGISQIARAICEMERITRASTENAHCGASVASELNIESESLNDIVRILFSVVEGNSPSLRAV